MYSPQSNTNTIIAIAKNPKFSNPSLMNGIFLLHIKTVAVQLTETYQNL